MVLTPPTTGKGRPRCAWQLEEGDPGSLELLQNISAARAALLCIRPTEGQPSGRTAGCVDSLVVEE